MAPDISKKRDSVVSNSASRRVVIGGPRAVRGRIIGETLSGGRNIRGVKSQPRYAPRPTKSSARHSLRPAAKTDDYSDFGLEAGEYLEFYEGVEGDGDYPAENTLTSSYAAGGTLQRQGLGFSVYFRQALSIAFSCLGWLFPLAVLAYFMNDLASDMPFLLVAPFPMLVVLLMGFSLGKQVKRKLQSGQATLLSALLGALLGSLLLGVAFYAYARFVGLYPISFLVDSMPLLPPSVQEFFVLIDNFVAELFKIFQRAFYAVIPLSGVVLGWIFGRR